MGIPDKDLDKTGSLDDKEAEIYREYCRVLKSRKFMDYDDQIVFADQIMRDPRFAAVADRYRNRFRWILVDEAQDTSKLQHQIIRNLAAGIPICSWPADEVRVYMASVQPGQMPSFSLGKLMKMPVFSDFRQITDPGKRLWKLLHR